MTAKQFVQNYNPKFIAESHVDYGVIRKVKYWLIREIGHTGYFAKGMTEAKAWKVAKEKIL